MSCSKDRCGPSKCLPRVGGVREKRGQAATYLEEPVVVNHAILCVEEGEQRVLGV